MFESTFIETADQAVGGMLDILTECASAENVRRGRLVEAVCEILDRRLADAEECGGDPSECHREVLCEISTQLTVSLSTGRTLLDTSEALNHLPLTALRLISGGIDWARVVVLASVLGKASARTVKAIEFQALAAAESMAPRRLRNRVWSLWMQFDGAEATAAQTEAKAQSTGVNIRGDGTGMAVLRAQMSDLQGAEAEALISEISATVCKKDPRTGQQRRVDGLLALLYGEPCLGVPLRAVGWNRVWVIAGIDARAGNPSIDRPLRESAAGFTRPSNGDPPPPPGDSATWCTGTARGTGGRDRPGEAWW
ncbi:DUF222 domain-containing protein [Rhodococcus sp. BP22]|uniref:DUF222 domain-containing protein n=1 Tax=Rhodococcus sp. BP22 TaxID=2758566 RepID=UPI0016444DA3|nr:DUF222 domain-containing protein [Rhodococcus sp. BP22]